MAAIACPHCRSVVMPDPMAISFCTRCGQALPAAVPSGPRVVSDVTSPTSSAGQAVVEASLTKQMQMAVIALFTIAAIFTVMIVVEPYLIEEQLKKENPNVYLKPVVYVVEFMAAAGFWSLYLWALRSPLPAAIVGLVLFATIQVLNTVNDPTTLAKGLYMKGFVLALLVQAIVGGMKHRRLLGQSAMK